MAHCTIAQVEAKFFSKEEEMREKLEEWLEKHPYHEGTSRAVQHFRLFQNEILPIALEADACAEIYVVGTHPCWSMDLPVVEIGMPKLGLRILARDNFQNTAFTVESENPVIGLNVSNLYFKDLTVFCFEGFGSASLPIHVSYEEDNRKFSARSGIELDVILKRLIDCLT